MTVDMSEFWHVQGLQSPDSRRVRLRKIPGDLAVTGGRPQVANPAPIDIWELRERDRTNAQQIAGLEKRVAELESERRERNNAGKEMRLIFSKEVTDLLAGEFASDEADELMVAMHRKMAAGDLKLAYELEAVAAGIPAPDDIDARSLALETLATSGLASFAPRLYSLIILCLTSNHESLQFGAIGAADLLPRTMRIELIKVIRAFVDQSAPNSSARRLGELYLENNS